MSPAGFELAIRASERPQTQALESAATGFGIFTVISTVILIIIKTKRRQQQLLKQQQRLGGRVKTSA
jgi:hypothetical protein